MKTLKTDQGEIEIQNPRDREATFEPAIVPKGKTRLEGFEDAILALYANGMTVRQIQDMIKELYYGADISPTVISNVTDAVIDKVKAWQNRSLNAVYAVLFLDCIVIKIHKEGRVVNQSVYLALAIDESGNKQALGIWISENESAKFWLSVLTKLKNRGVKDIIICCIDGLSGFAEAIEAMFPKASVQLCIVLMVRNSLRYVSTKDKQALVSDLKEIYHSPTQEAAEQALDKFAKRWSGKYPSIERL